MANAQATMLEIPVTIQGAKPVEGTDPRELFIETTKTILVFENGAVVNLESRVSLGQCVFLRNDQSGKEILCKVLEWRPVGQSGCTDWNLQPKIRDFGEYMRNNTLLPGGNPRRKKQLKRGGEPDHLTEDRISGSNQRRNACDLS